jgi:hypothetical protein
MFGGNPFGIDPSKMDPKALMELSNLVRELPPTHLNKMQTLMHNMMAGFDVRKEMEEFEKNLPSGFREKLMSIMLRGGVDSAFGGSAAQPQSASEPELPSGLSEAKVISPIATTPGTVETATAEMSVRDARLTVLRAVADGSMEPEDALLALWP